MNSAEEMASFVAEKGTPDAVNDSSPAAAAIDSSGFGFYNQGNHDDQIAGDDDGGGRGPGLLDAALDQLEAALSKPTKVWGHKDRLFCAAFGPSGRAVATSSADGTARVWDVTGDGDAGAGGAGGAGAGAGAGTVGARQRCELRGHTGGEVLRCAWHPDADAHMVATGGSDGTARLWNVGADAGRTGTERCAVPVAEDEQVYALAFASQGARLLVGYDDTLLQWDVAGQRTVHGARFAGVGAAAPHGGAARNPDSKAFVFDVAMPPNGGGGGGGGGAGELAAVGLSDGTIRVLDLRQPPPAAAATVKAHERFVASCAFSADGTALVSASGDGSAAVWDARTWGLRAVLRGHARAVFGAAFWPGSELVVTWGADGALIGWHPSDEPDEYALCARFERFPLYSVALSADGAFAALCGGESSVMGIMDWRLASCAGGSGALLRPQQQQQQSDGAPSVGAAPLAVADQWTNR